MLGVLAGAAASATLVKLTEYAGQGPDASYGAPLPVGRSGFAGYLATPSTFEFAPFVMDALLTSVPFVAVAVLAGVRALRIAVVAAAVSLVIPLFVALVTLGRVVMPLVPIPANAAMPTPLVIWANAVIWAVVGALATERIGRR